MKKNVYRYGKGGYVFISYSYQDTEKVRIIRNTFEEEGLEPLCFFLRCLDEDVVQDKVKANLELYSLIEREIAARDVFLYIESRHSRISEAVKKERDIIAKYPEKTVYQINIDNVEDLVSEAKRFAKRLRVFLSYSINDRNLGQIIEKELGNKDLRTSNELGLNEEVFEKPLSDIAKENIESASIDGCFVILISKDSLTNPYIKYEIESMLQILERDEKHGSILPILIGNDIDMNNPLFIKLMNYPHLKFEENIGPSDIRLIIQTVQQILRNKTID